MHRAAFRAPRATLPSAALTRTHVRSVDAFDPPSLARSPPSGSAKGRKCLAGWLTDAIHCKVTGSGGSDQRGAPGG